MANMDEVDDLLAGLGPQGHPAASSSSSSNPANGSAAQGASLTDDIDELCELLNSGGDAGGVDTADVDELLGALAAPAKSPSLNARLSPRLAPVRSPLGGSSHSPGQLASHVLSPQDTAEPDLPEPRVEMPEQVVPKLISCTGHFNLRCEVNLKTLSFGLRHAEYNPRKHTNITLRIMEPRATAQITCNGHVLVSGGSSPEDLKLAAKKVARLVQKCEHPEAKFAGYKLTNLLVKVRFGFPIRLDQVARDWRRNAVYEPELYCGCVFRLRKPSCSMLLTVSGCVMISGLNDMEDVKEVLRRAYSVFHDYQR